MQKFVVKKSKSAPLAASSQPAPVKPVLCSAEKTVPANATTATLESSAVCKSDVTTKKAVKPSASSPTSVISHVKMSGYLKKKRNVRFVFTLDGEIARACAFECKIVQLIRSEERGSNGENCMLLKRKRHLTHNHQTHSVEQFDHEFYCRRQYGSARAVNWRFDHKRYIIPFSHFNWNDWMGRKSHNRSSRISIRNRHNGISSFRL